MKKTWLLVLFSAFVSLVPSVQTIAATKHTSMATMPTCKGRVAWVMSNHRYVLSGNVHYGKGHGMYMCEATARARGYHMMVTPRRVRAHGMPMSRGHMTTHPTVPAGTPMPNPSGNLKAEPGATPNGNNMQNGVQTTVAPAPTASPHH